MTSPQQLHIHITTEPNTSLHITGGAHPAQPPDAPPEDTPAAAIDRPPNLLTEPPHTAQYQGSTPEHRRETAWHHLANARGHIYAAITSTTGPQRKHALDAAITSTHIASDWLDLANPEDRHDFTNEAQDLIERAETTLTTYQHEHYETQAPLWGACRDLGTAQMAISTKGVRTHHRPLPNPDLTGAARNLIHTAINKANACLHAPIIHEDLVEDLVAARNILTQGLLHYHTPADRGHLVISPADITLWAKQQHLAPDIDLTDPPPVPNRSQRVTARHLPDHTGSHIILPAYQVPVLLRDTHLRQSNTEPGKISAIGAVITTPEDKRACHWLAPGHYITIINPLDQ